MWLAVRPMTSQRTSTIKSRKVRIDAYRTDIQRVVAKVTKAYAAKALKELHEQQIIAGKAAGVPLKFEPVLCLLSDIDITGKQIVYHAIQDPKDAVSPEDLTGMDEEIADLRESIATAKANEKLLRANLIAVNATLSTADLHASVTALELEKKEILARLGSLRSGSVKPVSPEEKAEVEKAWTQWSRKANIRKKICMELWAYCTEELEREQAKEELWV